MLEITIPAGEAFDPVKEEFVNSPGCTLKLEHSLVSISKWEAKWKRPFLEKGPITTEEIIDYVKCMTITQNVRPDVYMFIDASIMSQINDYINDTRSATKIKQTQNKKPGPREIYTSEVLYAYMVSLQIPFECQKWHLNRLLTLIQSCNRLNEPPKKLSAKDRRAINAANRKRFHTKG